MSLTLGSLPIAMNNLSENKMKSPNEPNVRLIRLQTLAAALLALTACGSVPPAPPIYYPTKEEVRGEAKPQAQAELTEIEIPLFVVPGEKPAAPSGKTDGQLVIENQNRYRVTARKAQFFGGAVIYNYIPNHVYQLFCKPFAVTDIALEPGEQLTGAPVSGDTMNFIVGTGTSIEGGQERLHVYIKPVYGGKRTTLNLNTNRRSYRFDVQSFEHTAMSVITFEYPLEAMKKSSERPAGRIAVGSTDITRLNYNYKIIPMAANRPAWLPSIVFNDGAKTYINFASAEWAAYAPVLFEIRGKKRAIINYRVDGTYYIIEGVPKHMELALDTNAGNIVTILYEGR
jgi:P-type conjugative transfer protein TrbG